MTPADEVFVRAASLADAGRIDEMLNDYAVVRQGRSLSPGTAAAKLTAPGAESVVATDGAGRVLGFGQMARPGAAVRCFVRVRPDATGKGVGTALLDHLERRAPSFGSRIVNVFQPGTDTAGPGLLQPRGYTEFR